MKISKLKHLKTEPTRLSQEMVLVFFNAECTLLILTDYMQYI